MEDEDKDYVCTLDAASIKKAKEELFEDPNDRLSAVKALRDWVKSQPHINCGTLDTQTLLIFLRSSKFSQIRAREMFEGNLNLKNLAPEWFLDIDTCDKKTLEVIDSGYILPLPKRSKDGCSVLLYRLGAVKPKQFTFQELMKAGMVVGAYISDTEMTQVNGTVFIFDFTGTTAAHISGMMNKEVGKFHKLWQKNLPGRFKGFHYYNAGLFFETLMAFTRPLMPKKFQDRIKLHDTLESLYEHVPMELLPEEFLPDEYTGPNAGSIKNITNSFKSVITNKAYQEDLLFRSSKKYSIDMSKKPAETVTTHFRKLNVD